MMEMCNEYIEYCNDSVKKCACRSHMLTWWEQKNVMEVCNGYIDECNESINKCACRSVIDQYGEHNFAGT